MTLVAGSVPFTFAALAALHLFWAGGGRWGAVATVPERAGKPIFRPSAAASVVVAGLLGAAALGTAAVVALSPP